MNPRSDTTKQLRELTASLDTTKQLRELATVLTRSEVLEWARNVELEMSEPVEALADVAAILQEPVSEDDPIPRWLGELPELRQRRLLLFSLAALWALTDLTYSVAGVTPPAHLGKIILALLAIATLVNELVDDPSDGE